MEEFGDDFGDLYADVEIQASSAINGIPGLSNSYIEPMEEEEDEEEEEEDNTVTNKHIGSNSKEFDAVHDGSARKTMGSEVNVNNGSDSEDDLNIVLNDEDYKNFPVTSGGNVRNEGVVGGGGDGDGYGDNEDEDGGDNDDEEGSRSGKNRKRDDQSGDGLELASNGHGGERGNGVRGGYNSMYPKYKYMRPHGSLFPSNSKGNGSVGMASYPSMLTRGDWDDSPCNQHKGSIAGQVAHVRATANSVAGQSGYGFSLPWYRTILDINIDTFEEKPWGFPGVDLTDFFNFGFNEETWKQYCNSQEQIRQQEFLQTGIPVYESSKTNQAHEARSEYERGCQNAIVDESYQGGLQRIISPSSKFADSKPRGRAIQVEDSISERQPSMDVRRPRTRDSDVVIQITVQDPTEDSSGSGKEEVHHKDSTVHEASEKGDYDADDSKDIHCSGNASGDEPSVKSLEGNVRRLERCSQQMIAYYPMNLDSDNHENEMTPDVNEHHHEKLKVGPPGVTEVMETVNETRGGVGRNSCSADPCMMETELSFDDCGQLSLDSSYYGSDSEASRDSFCVDAEKTQSPVRVSSLSSSAELPESVTSCDKNFKRSSIKSKSGDGNSRNKGSNLEEQERHSRRGNSVAIHKIHTADNDDASPMLDGKDLCDRDQLLVKRSRWKERKNIFGFKDREDLPYHREKELSHRYSGEMFTDNDNEKVYGKHPYSRGNHRLRDDIDSYVRKKWDERDHCHEQRIPRVYNEDRDRDWYHCGGRSTDYLSHLTYRESQLDSRYSSCSVEERDSRLRREHGELQLQKRINHSHWLDYKHEDNFVPEKYKRSASFADRNRDSMDEKYERQFPYSRGEMNSGRRGRYGDGPTLDLDNPWPNETEDGYQRLMDCGSVGSRFYRESYTAGRCQPDTMSPRNNVYNSRLSERFGRCRRHMCNGEVRDSGWLDNFNDADDVEDCIIYPDDQGHLGLSQYSWRSRVLHWTEDELILRHQNDRMYSEEASLSYEKITRHERIRARYGSAHDGMLDDEMQVRRHKLKMIKKGSSINGVNRSSEIINRDKHDQAVLRCRDSVDFVVGDGKSSGRCSKDGSFMGNGRSENRYQKIEKKRTTLMDYNEPHMEKAVHPEIPKIEGSQNNAKWLDKFPITEPNEDLDIEEGQIVTEEPNTEDPTGRRYVSEDAALPCNNGFDGNKVVGGYDNQRILESLAKMEKRRERFKDSITLKKEPGKSPQPQLDLIVDTDGTKQLRPARKRRWGGS